MKSVHLIQKRVIRIITFSEFSAPTAPTTIKKTLHLNIYQNRTRMLNVNGNYHNRNTYPNCRACGNNTETQEHILEECPALMDDKNERIKKDIHVL